MNIHSRVSSQFQLFLTVGCFLLIGASCALPPLKPTEQTTKGGSFTIAMIPDTQNYLDYTHQEVEGFALDSAELFMRQMEWIADRARSRGGEIDFVASVGDTWQHTTQWIDPEHEAMGIGRVDNPLIGNLFDPTPEGVAIEMAKAIEGYQLIADAAIPFGIPPGNHDYDAMYTVDKYPPNYAKKPVELTLTIEDVGALHYGGLTNFLSAFGQDSPFFAGKPWYVSAFEGGTSSAQVFEAGGYRFLHLALEMQPGDDVLDWAKNMMAEFPGLPTIVTTHDYLSPNGERESISALDFTLVDPQNHNTTQQIFEKLIEPSDQIFLVLCGHHIGQALRIDENLAGNKVYQVLADYQGRGQVVSDAVQTLESAGNRPAGVGDGWLRLLHFDMTVNPPTISMRTYSTHYKKHSSELATYAEWYREQEQPNMTDEEFLAAEEYEITLDDFQARFGIPNTDGVR